MPKWTLRSKRMQQQTRSSIKIKKLVQRNGACEIILELRMVKVRETIIKQARTGC